MNTKNSSNVTWINTTTHRCGRAIPDATASEMESDASYPLPTFPEPSDELSEEDMVFRATFWRIYLLVGADQGLRVKPPIQLTGGRVAWRKRVRLFFRFLLQPTFRG
jgi:hypothetical protein